MTTIEAQIACACQRPAAYAIEIPSDAADGTPYRANLCEDRFDALMRKGRTDVKFRRLT